jgi:hypothetical protein
VVLPAGQLPLSPSMLDERQANGQTQHKAEWFSALAELVGFARQTKDKLTDLTFERKRRILELIRLRVETTNGPCTTTPAAWATSWWPAAIFYPKRQTVPKVERRGGLLPVAAGST